MAAEHDGCCIKYALCFNFVMQCNCQSTQVQQHCCAARSPKGIAKLLTVSESGRLRSPPLVDKFRRTKENMLQSVKSQPTNDKLLSLKRMFHEARACPCLLPEVHSPSVYDSAKPMLLPGTAD